MSEDRNRDLAEIISYNESERIEHVIHDMHRHAKSKRTNRTQSTFNDVVSYLKSIGNTSSP